jgi:hypothetical protein
LLGSIVLKVGIKKAKSVSLKLASIRVLDDGAPPIVEKGREAPFKQGDFYVFDVEDDVARYWNKLAPAKRAELSKQSRKMNKDLRLILDPFVHRPRTTK